MNAHLLSHSTIGVVVGLLLLTLSATAVAESSWPLQISNLSGNQVTLSYEELLAMPKTVVLGDLSCYGLLLTSANWGGVRLVDLLQEVGIDPQASSVDFNAQDGYLITIPLERAVQPDVVVAYERDGEGLCEKLRLVVPGANGNVWIAMITSVRLSTSTSQIEGQFVTAGITPLKGLPSSSTLSEQGSMNDANDVLDQSQTTNEPSNETAAQPNSSDAADVQPPASSGSIENELLFAQPDILVVLLLAAVLVFLAISGHVAYRRHNGASLRSLGKT